MSNATTELIIDTPTGISIDKDDVLAVGVVRAEDHMNEEFTRCRKGADDALKDGIAAAEKCQEILSKHAEEYAKEEIDRFEQTVKAMGAKCNEPNVTHGVIVESGRRRLYNVDLSQSSDTRHRQKPSPKAGEKLTTKRSSCFSSQSDGYVIAPREAVVLHDLSLTKEKERKALEKEAMDWKRRLARIPQYERKLRADMASQRLSKSVEGQEMLDLMLGNVENRVLGLPCK